MSNAAIDALESSRLYRRRVDEQMSALLMAIWRGMDRGEIARWTSGHAGLSARLDFTDLPLATVDKLPPAGRSSKITLPLVPSPPAVAQC